MNVISSKNTWSKKIFPIIWFGFLGVFILIGILSGTLMAVVGPLIMIIFGYFLMKKLVWDLVDQVIDNGDHLLVKNKDEEEIIYLNNIMNISSSTNQSPPRATLRLRSPCKFGEEISFSPKTEFGFNPFSKNKIVEDLIVRIDKAKN